MNVALRHNQLDGSSSLQFGDGDTVVVAKIPENCKPSVLCELLKRTAEAIKDGKRVILFPKERGTYAEPTFNVDVLQKYT